jgi:glyoxylase-like metal-dependent hydrolase (beta-lactamase superfamily II)/rhodanese-related sulfurtransferase
VSGEWTPEELGRRLLANERFGLLDVRGRDEFEAWRIEGRAPLAQLNVPYYDLLERANSDLPVDNARALLDDPAAAALRREGTVLAVCAKGSTSAFVASGLRELGVNAVNLAGGMAAWAATTVTRPIVRGDGLTIFQIARPARGCLSHVVASRGIAAIVDPLHDLAPYHALLAAEQLQARWVIDTHAHADHVSGGPALAAALEVPYRLHPYDAIHPMDMLPATVGYEPLRDGETLALGAISLEALHVPGHTLGNLALLAGDHLIAGDTIFVDSIARPDLGGHGAEWAALHWRSLRRLLALGDEIVVLPGHFSRLAEARDDGTFRARLGDLRRFNAGLVAAERSEPEFVAYILANLPEFPARYVDIKRVNLGLKHADEDAVAELETGKNICAMAAAAAP